MVQLMKSGGVHPEHATTLSLRNKASVKVERVLNSIVEDDHQLCKRSKPSQFSQQHGDDAKATFVPRGKYNPLDEPSPLGLQLKKSPSLLDLIQMKLSQGTKNAATQFSRGKDSETAAVPSATDKLKASNFPALFLRIGCWEYKSKYEGDLIAKCYFAKHKLVWEVLEGGLKSKIEIQWADIMALRANFPDCGPASLIVTLVRQPLFFRETNPQPRKHTLWQATTDFTNGHASLHRQHFLQCSQGMLNKHFEKLIQCDTRLNFLSSKPEIILDSPYFEQKQSIFDDLDMSESQNFIQLPINEGPSSASHSCSMDTEKEHTSREASSPSSVMDRHTIEQNGNCGYYSLEAREMNQVEVAGLHRSMSVTDLVNHIGSCISEQAAMSHHNDSSGCKKILEEIAQHLLGDGQQLSSSTDDQRLMSRVNSLRCLLLKDSDENGWQELAMVDDDDDDDDHLPHLKDPSSCRHQASISRKDSFGELLLNLPRIASLPKFLFGIYEDGDDQLK